MMRKKWDYITLKSCGRVTSDIFVKESEGSSEKILKYVECKYLSIFFLSQKKHDLRIYNFATFKVIETERYTELTCYLRSHLFGLGRVYSSILKLRSP